MDDSMVQLLHDSRQALRQGNAYVLFYIRTDLAFIEESSSLASLSSSMPFNGARTPAKRKASQFESENGDDEPGGHYQKKKASIGPQLPSSGWKKATTTTTTMSTPSPKSPAMSNGFTNGAASSQKSPIKYGDSPEEVGVKVDRWRQVGGAGAGTKKASLNGHGGGGGVHSGGFQGKKKLKLANAMRGRPAIIR
jgi:hypothetical protein